MHGLAHIKHIMGDQLNAQEIMHKVLDMRMKLFGNNHDLTLHSFDIFKAINQKLGHTQHDDHILHSVQRVAPKPKQSSEGLFSKLKNIFRPNA